MEKQGFGNVVASIGKLGGEVPYTTFNARKSFIENNPETIESFTNAIQEGIDYTFSHSEEELADIIIDYFTDTSKKDLIEVIKRYKDNDSWYKTTYITEDGWNRIQNIMEYNKVLDSRVDYKILVDNTYSNE
ncbi:MAG: ABC transporter substrate-binding protein [Bacilli bacterium]